MPASKRLAVAAAGVVVGAVGMLTTWVFAQSNVGTLNMNPDTNLGLTCPNGLTNSNKSADSESVICAENPTTTTTLASTTTTVGPTTTTTVPGTGSGCQFLTRPGDIPAFCDSFSEGPSPGGREGQLNPALWSVTRVTGLGNAQNLMPFPQTPVSACQSGVTSVTPDNDILVCDRSSGHSGQILSALGAQNYAAISMRPRQPFDFANGGTVSFNVDAVTNGGLSWWPSVYITDQPTAGAEDAVQVLGLLPRNGIGMDFDGCQNNAGGTDGGIGAVYTYRNYVETDVVGASSVNSCYATSWGSLNHFEIQLSQTHVTVWASDAGGSNFRQVFSAPISLNFSQGYVFFQSNERAPVKYGDTPSYTNYYWSDIGFDGPLANTGEVGYSVPDALTPDPADNGVIPTVGAPNVGYGVLNNPSTMYTCCNGSSPTDMPSLSIPKVNLAGVKSAYLSFDVAYTYVGSFTASNVALLYSLNGGPLISPNPPPDPIAQEVCHDCPGAPVGGLGVTYLFPVPLSALASGTNTVSFSVPGSDNGYPPVVTGVDLLTFTTATPIS